MRSTQLVSSGTLVHEAEDVDLFPAMARLDLPVHLKELKN